MSSEVSRVRVRPVEEHEVSRVIDFVRKGFKLAARFSPEALRRLFEYRWSGSSDRPNLGFALWSGHEIVGFLGAIYAERPLAGRRLKTCNLSTWYVRPDFHGAAIKLLFAVMSQKDYTITNLTSSPGVRQIMEGLGFQPIDRCKLVYLPWHFRREMLRSAPDVLTDPKEIANVVKGDERHFLHDHLPYRLSHYVLRDGDDHSYLILKRRSFPGEVAFSRIPIKKLRLMWYRCMEVVYLGNPQLSVRKWGRLVASILRRERVFAVVVAERFLGANAPAGARLDHASYLLARAPLNATLDSLYSELVLLP